MQVKERIFGKQTRILRTRKLHKKLKALHKEISEAVIIDNEREENDNRPFQSVNILGKNLSGLMDSGASISCLGRDAEKSLKSINKSIVKFYSSLRCAGGSKQDIIGFVFLPVTFLGQTKEVKFFVAPGLIQELYLGCNFWKLFNVKLAVVDEIQQDGSLEMHELTEKQQLRLEKVVQMFS